MVNKQKSERMSIQLSSYVYLLHNELGESIRKINKRYPQFSKNTIWRHATKDPSKVDDKVKTGKPRGRPRKISDRDERQIIRTLKHVRKTNGGKFTAKRIQYLSGINKVSLRSVRKVLNKHGYAFRPARRKGILLASDLPKRLQFAKKVLKYYDPTLWTNDICFYLDGKSFIHKLHPQDQARAPGARIWRRKDEGLNLDCTAKAKKSKTGSRLANFFVAISYQKGVILCENYEHLDGPFFAKFIKKNFVKVFNRSNNPEGNLFVQDGDPSQTSMQAKLAMEQVNAVQFSIPPRSPDCNPIENFFNLIEKKLHTDAVEQNIRYEPYPEFIQRIKKTMLEFPTETIDKIICSMHNRMLKIVQRKGQRIAY